MEINTNASTSDHKFDYGPGTIITKDVSAEESDEQKSEVVQEEETTPPNAKDLIRVTADSNKALDGYLDYDDGNGVLRYHYTYRRIPHGRVNQLRLQAMSETTKAQDYQERRFQ